MEERLLDYGIVLGVVLVLMGLFRLSRFLLRRFTARENFDADRALVWAGYFLLSGLLLLPFITALLAFADNQALAGGMPLHLFLTAISVVLFSFAEDLFRDYNSYGSRELKPLSWHVKKLLIPVLVFWIIGCVFISPLFYSGLTVLTSVFYRLCLFFRKTGPGKN
ncbi:hypothetical protein CSA37_07040 [Candidatus Fermentibacteria bacterium]|nr:MAG: hypothetical protein CSA37_09935 [Candidatus Fermentibacteria bacterium]PIE52314.1 MAG: hypothetical protein CSA37_07040 [Candidatus Fermentibacteria bacterium]